MRDFIIFATDNLYRPPNQFLISGDLLDQQYTEVKGKVDTLLRGQDSLNFVLDESTNISSHRIINLSVVIPRYRSIFLTNKSVGKEDLIASFLPIGLFREPLNITSYVLIVLRLILIL